MCYWYDPINVHNYSVWLQFNSLFIIGLPFIIVAIAAGVSHEQYAVKNEEGQFQ